MTNPNTEALLAKLEEAQKLCEYYPNTYSEDAGDKAMKAACLIGDCLDLVRQHTAQPEVMDDLKLYDLAQRLIIECTQPTMSQSITTKVMDILRPHLRTNSGEE